MIFTEFCGPAQPAPPQQSCPKSAQLQPAAHLDQVHYLTSGSEHVRKLLLAFNCNCVPSSHGMEAHQASPTASHASS